jgi:hypothetical protein
MIKFLRGLGITSDVAYLAGVLSIGASIAAWTASSRMENAPGEKADRWGIYVGLWGPDLHGARQCHPNRRGQRLAPKAATRTTTALVVFGWPQLR